MIQQNVNSIDFWILFELIKYVFTAILYLGVALYIDWKLTLGVLIVAPVLMVTDKKIFEKIKKVLGKKDKKQQGS